MQLGPYSGVVSGPAVVFERRQVSVDCGPHGQRASRRLLPAITVRAPLERALLRLRVTEDLVAVGVQKVVGQPDIFLAVAADAFGVQADVAANQPSSLRALATAHGGGSPGATCPG